MNIMKAANEGIRNLLFDLGGVIMDLRREDCVEALTRLGMKGANELLGLYSQKGAFMLLEEGKISPAEFRNEMRTMIEGNVSDQQLDDAFNQFLTGIPRHRLDALLELKKTYKIYMLSNTNPIMFDSRIREEFRKGGLEMEDYFDGICVSYKEGCAKPDPQIFHNLTKEFNIKPEETLFFDDSQLNTDAAARLGFRTWTVKPGTEFMDAFKESQE